MMVLLLPRQKFAYLPCCVLVVDNQKVWNWGRLQNRKSGTGTCLTLHSPVVTMCTAQWSLYVPHSGHYMYRTVVNICTAQWSLCVPHSGHYMYRTVVSICTAQWSLCVPHSGQYMYRTVVTICTASLTFNKSVFCLHSLCVLCGSENKRRLFHCTALTGWFL